MASADAALDPVSTARSRLIDALRAPDCYPHPVAAVDVLETHISWVVLTGAFAYKIKKAVDLGFLDFSTPARRRFFCEEEVRLNRRLLPGLYIGVVGIGGTPEQPRFGASGTAWEYAVKMHEFPQSALFDRMLGRGELAPRHIDALAERVAAFHQGLTPADPAADYGQPAAVWATLAQSIGQLRRQLADDPVAVAELAWVDELDNWCREQYAGLADCLAGRRGDGWVRECHGDLHLGNVALIDGAPGIFDCIEFAPALRWIDVINDLAFMSMDLAQRGQAAYRWRFLNRYLAATGDYAGLRLLAFYEVARALVRANVARLRAGQLAPAERAGALVQAGQYLQCARHLCRPRRACLLLLHGVSGAGKSRLAQAVAEALGAVHLRSDLERKRLAGMPALARDDTLYDAATTRRTYRRLADLAAALLAAGYPVIVDAANLKAWQRELFRDLACRLDRPCRILSCTAPEVVLLERLRQRVAAGDDASDADGAVLRRQFAGREALSGDEQTMALTFDTASAETADIVRQIEQELAS